MDCDFPPPTKKCVSPRTKNSSSNNIETKFFSVDETSHQQNVRRRKTIVDLQLN